MTDGLPGGPAVNALSLSVEGLVVCAGRASGIDVLWSVREVLKSVHMADLQAAARRCGGAARQTGSRIWIFSSSDVTDGIRSRCKLLTH